MKNKDELMSKISEAKCDLNELRFKRLEQKILQDSK